MCDDKQHSSAGRLINHKLSDILSEFSCYFRVFSRHNSPLNISFHLAEVESLNQVEKLENAQFHEDLMLFSLDSGRATLTKVVVSFNKVVVNFMRRVMTKLQRPKASTYNYQQQSW